MTTTFNPFALNLFGAGFTWTGTHMGLALAYHMVVPSTTTPNGVDGLFGMSGYQEVVAAGYTRVVVATDAVVEGSTTKVVYAPNWVLTNTDPVYVAAGVWYLVGTYGGVVNPWVMISDEMFGNVVTAGATIGADTAPRYMFAYVVKSDGSVAASLQDISQEPGPTTWEPARTQHVYLYPQRINWIPNPSFEDVGNFGWRSNGTMTRTLGGVDSSANHFLRVTGGDTLESIAIPRRRTVRFSAFVRSHGAQFVSLNLVNLDDGYDPVNMMGGPAHQIYSDWMRIDDILFGADDSAAQIPHIEADGDFDVDLVLLEDTPALHAYFDGDSQMGMPYDFSWQTNEAQSYSFWYNNRYLVASRLFGAYTEGQLTLPSLIQEWVPTGTSLMTHWDVLSPLDTRHPLEDWSSRSI